VMISAPHAFLSGYNVISPACESLRLAASRRTRGVVGWSGSLHLTAAFALASCFRSSKSNYSA
jgi:hypothetical protein